MEAFSDDKATLPCECTGHRDDKHIIKGKLKITTNNKLCKSFTNSTKWKENITADYGRAKEIMITGTESCIQSWCN